MCRNPWEHPPRLPPLAAGSQRTRVQPSGVLPSGSPRKSTSRRRLRSPHVGCSADTHRWLPDYHCSASVATVSSVATSDCQIVPDPAPSLVRHTRNDGRRDHRRVNHQLRPGRRPLSLGSRVPVGGRFPDVVHVGWAVCVARIVLRATVARSGYSRGSRAEVGEPPRPRRLDVHELGGRRLRDRLLHSPLCMLAGAKEGRRESARSGP
jgi:hypothetical protein